MLTRHRLAALAALLLLAAAPARSSPSSGASVTTYHNAPDRSGASVMPGLTLQSAASMGRDRGFDGRVPDAVYAQPLFWRPPGGGPGLVIVATEADTVLALDAVSGRVVWQRRLGDPVPRSQMPCGDVDPLGITGTPVIDPARGAVYLDAMVQSAAGPQHRIFGLSLRDGSVLPGWPVDVAAGLAAQGSRFTPTLQNQRSALALLNGRLFVPYGGNWGDCGPYRGWVVGLSIDHPAVLGSFATRGLKGGIWATGGIATEGGGLLVATGNTSDAAQWSDGEAVLRLGPTLAAPTSPRDYFAPANWKYMDENDLDLGGSNPMPVTAGGRRLVLAVGKDGRAYLLDAADLGGIGGALAVRQVADNEIITAPASWRAGPDAMVAFQADGAGCPRGSAGTTLLALRISGGAHPAIGVAWCARLPGRGEPITTSSDAAGADRIVWAVGAEGDDRLHGYDARDGRPVFAGGGAADRMRGLRHFVTILAAAGRLYVAGDGRLYAFAVQAVRQP